MKDNMPTLKECFENNKELNEFGLQLLLLYSCGYSIQDFEEYINQMLEDKDVKEAVKAFVPLLELVLKDAKKEH